MDVKILANFGYHKGASGTGLLYVAKASNGPYLCAIKFLDNGLEHWVYYRKSMVDAGYSGGDIVISSDFNLSLLTDAVSPEFVTDSTGAFKDITTVTNGADLPRLYNLEQPYTIKGEGVTSAELDAVKTGGSTTTPPPPTGTTTTPGTTTNAGGLGGIIPSDFSGLFSNPIKFVQDNPVFVLLVLGVIYFLRRKQKKPLWLF